MKSSLVNMVAVLLGITAVTSSAVGLVYRVTEAPIARAKLQKKADALSQVLPDFDNTPADEMQPVATDGGEIYVYTARMGGEAVGYAVESFAAGFSGTIRIMVGFEADGSIRNIQVLEQTETPGLGAKLAEEGNPVQASFIGRIPAEMKMSVRKDGGDVDAITASTISSRAYVQAVSRAYTAFLEASGADASGWDASSGATSAGQQDTASEQPDSESGATNSGGTASASTERASGVTAASSGNADTVTGATASEGAADAAATSGNTDTVTGATVSEEAEAASGATVNAGRGMSDREQKGQRQ